MNWQSELQGRLSAHVAEPWMVGRARLGEGKAFPPRERCQVSQTWPLVCRMIGGDVMAAWALVNPQ
jgi:hypothetical protein